MLASISAPLLALIVSFLPQSGPTEVAFLDLTGVVPRTQLRRPPAPPPKCDASGRCTMLGGSVGGSVGDCGLAANEPRALRVTLLRLDQDVARRGDRVGYEVLVENVGAVELSIPVSPHLADFQPPDPEESFTVEETGIGIRFTRGDAVTETAINFLYSSADRPETSVHVHPGESFRLRSTFLVSPSWWKDRAGENTELKAVPYVNLASSTYRQTPTGSFTAKGNKCPRIDSAPSRAFTLLTGPATPN